MTMTVTNRIKTGIFYRAARIAEGAVNEEARTVELSFSSEEPAQRAFGTEVLDHASESVRLQRLNTGGALLVDHNTSDQVGVVEKAYLGSDRRGRAVVRFSRSARAEEIFRDVIDGIRSSISVGYRILKAVVERNGKDEIYRAVDWEPLEISLVSVPMDVSVGVGRTHSEDFETEIIYRHYEEIKVMETVVQKDEAQQTAAQVREQELARIKFIQRTGELHNLPETMVREALNSGTSVEDFREQALAKIAQCKPTQTPDLGLTPTETQRFSLTRAIRALADNNWALAPFEAECSRAIAQRVGSPKFGGFLVPYEVQKRKFANQHQRDLTVGTLTAGGYLVETELAAGSFIELLRNQAKVVQLGARMLPGLVGNVSVPRQTSAATAYWVSENAALTESQLALGQIALLPKTIGGYTEISRQLLMQSTPAADMLVMEDIGQIIAIGIDLAAINGSGASGQPLGVMNVSGVGSVDGTTIDWAKVVEFETDVSAANADVASMAYLAPAGVRGLLKTRFKDTSTGISLWGGLVGNNEMNGYRAEVSNQVPAARMIFGDWSQIVIGEWGTLEISLNPFANFQAGTIGIRGFQTCDIAVRQAGAFSVSTAIT